jgi:hypothetical protein
MMDFPVDGPDRAVRLHRFPHSANWQPVDEIFQEHS